ncbi:hypothetical protein N7507_001510 [Penicillium longicatenatum]|nr:hypothetical protein N7507_001510 [Penicillium longicatenatum]
MATAQMTAGPRSARLADDAATAALYAVQPRRKASVREKPASDINNPQVKGASSLSAASAGAAIAHANRKPVEIWRPGRLTEAETAAYCVRDFKAPEIPKPSTQYSSEGLGAAILAVREQRNSNLSPTRETQRHEYSRNNQDKALRAATGAYATGRRRADSAPSEPVITSDSPYALSAAGVSHRNKTDEEEPLDHLDSAMEASRIRHLANTNAKMYTSSPPIQSEAQERNRKNSLHAAAISMAKEMYDPNNPKVPVRSKTVGGTEGSTAQRAMTLQEAAQKRAAEKLALMHNEQAELQSYYGTTPQPARSRLTARRKRTASDADSVQVDAEQSRYIRNQMKSLRTKVNDVDEKRTRDRALLMEAARRNVDATLMSMEMKMYADKGRAPPSLQKEWDEAAHERVRREAEAAEANSAARGNRVNIGTHQYMDMADVEAVARSRLQPTLDEITESAEQKRADEVEARLDAEEKERHAAIEREREASMTRVADSRDKGSNKDKRNSKVMSFLWRMKSKRARPSEEAAAQESADHEATNEEAVAQDEGAQEATATAAGIAPEETKEAPKEETEPETEPEATKEPEQELVQEPEREAMQEPKQEAAVVQDPEAPEAAGAATLTTAAHVGAPVSITEPTEHDGRPAMMGRSHTSPRDAAAVGTGPAPMHDIRPITSPRADSKLRTWFRDQLVRRSSGPEHVYPHQPGPDFNSESEIGFSGGATLAARPGSRPESRGAALSSHPVSGNDLDQGEPARNGSLDVGKTNTFSDSSAGSVEPATNGHAKSRRERFKKTFLKSVSRTDDTKINGSGTVPETKVQGTNIRGLRDSAVDQGLPVPPVLGESASAGRESRFSEDLS